MNATQSSQLIQAALEHHRAGRLLQADAIYQQALQADPDNPDALHYRGAIAYDQGKAEIAAGLISKAVGISPSRSMYYNLGNALKALGRLDEAARSYRNALALKPDYVQAHVNLGNTLKEQGKLDEAIASYRSALALQPDLAEAYNNLADAVAEQGKPGSVMESVRYYQKAYAARTSLQSQPGADETLAPAVTLVFLELTNKCNFHCDFCPSDILQRPRSHMSMDMVRKVYDEVTARKLAQKICLHLMGEPTLHPHLTEILAYGAAKRIKTGIVTNGSTITARSAVSLLDNLYGDIAVSLQTPTRETYRHRGDTGLSWDRYVGNIRLLVREHLRRVARAQEIRYTLEVRVMVTQDSKLTANILQNEQEVNAILDEWCEFVSEAEREFGLPAYQRNSGGMDISQLSEKGKPYTLQQGLKLVFWQGFPFANSRLDNEYGIKLLGKGKFCNHPFIDVGVLCNGDVTLCCLDYDGQLVVGNVGEDTLENILNQERARNLRAAMLSCHSMPKFCQQCQAEVIRREPDGAGLPGGQ